MVCLIFGKCGAVDYCKISPFWYLYLEFWESVYPIGLLVLLKLNSCTRFCCCVLTFYFPAGSSLWSLLCYNWVFIITLSLIAVRLFGSLMKAKFQTSCWCSPDLTWRQSSISPHQLWPPCHPFFLFFLSRNPSWVPSSHIKSVSTSDLVDILVNGFSFCWHHHHQILWIVYPCNTSIHELREPFHFGFRTHYSTETALIKITNNLIADSGYIILIVIVLSGAFDLFVPVAAVRVY